ncbi:MAG: purine-binding chemotaxis protein CheW [Porticoccus sp.]|nr:purine-binding chemotaxis protein CheW [Porticoccus sp.]MBQ0808103.1 purine-binding chemotaxis protein CheW [Porticoccus sp.]
MNMGKILENTFEDTDGDGSQYLTFILADEEYGVEILRVQEIRGWTKVTPMPNQPSYLRGVINLRGNIVPIIDLRERFGIESMEYGATTVVIVIRVESEGAERIMGIVVDAVSEVYTVSDSDCQPPPDLGNAIDEQFVNGLVSVDEKMVILLDVDLLLHEGVLDSAA